MKFGSFESFCNNVALIPCAYLENRTEPKCYARNIQIKDTLVFQPATLIVHIVALCMTSIMISHIKSKYTAVGRKEIVLFFYLYIAEVILEFLLLSNFIPTSSSAYPWFAAIFTGTVTSMIWCLMLNGFVGFQWAEDGTALSLWSIRLSTLLMFGVTFFVSIGTFNNFAGLSSSQPIALWIFYFLLNVGMLLIWVIMQIILVTNTLDDRWPLGDILFGVAFFMLGQLFQLAFSSPLCEAATHYIDGMFFGTICSLLGVMMVYKYWDSITKEDLEFSVGAKENVWEIRDEYGAAPAEVRAPDAAAKRVIRGDGYSN